VPSSAVENQRNVLVLGNRLGKSVEKCLHASTIRIGQDQREGIVGAGLDGRVDIGIRVALIDETRRPLAAFPPDVADAALLPDACLILKIEAQAFVFIRTLNFEQDAPGSF
jgi:hypothetical protein